MTPFLRSDDACFDALSDWSYRPHDHYWNGLRVRYVDEGPRDAPVMLLLHGMPTWSYLYRTMIPMLVDAGYRCVAPDHLGFGRSDKPTDPAWYSIARHSEVLASLIDALELRDVTLVCQDWGGPIGLTQVVVMPERFSRLIVMNAWLHHPGFEYSDGMRNWVAMWKPGGVFDRSRPNVACVPLFSGALASMSELIVAIANDTEPVLDGPAATSYAAWSAPFRDLPDEAFNGARRFPHSIPIDGSNPDNAAAHAEAYRQLLDWPKPVHFVWGGADPVFAEAWGREWASAMHATFDLIADANHFLQDTHGPEVADIILGRIAEES